LKKEFSDENIVFWIACENFRNLTEFEEVHVHLRSQNSDLLKTQLTENLTVTNICTSSWGLNPALELIPSPPLPSKF